MVASARSHAQPNNNHFSKATNITKVSKPEVTTYTTNKVNISYATIEKDEHFDSILVNSDINAKSVWFSFELEVARKVTVNLNQKNAEFDPKSVGLSVYDSAKSLPGKDDLSASFPSINKFGASINECAKPGVYFIQVAATKKAFGEIWLSLEIDNPGQAPNDFAANAIHLGSLDSNLTTTFETGCFSIDDDDSNCSGLEDYTQSLWMTFKTNLTPNVINARIKRSRFANERHKVHYSFYEGDCRKGTSNLVALDECSGRLALACNLKSNTTYSICMRFHQKEESAFEFKLNNNGEGTVYAADPNNIDTSFQLGKIITDQTFTLEENLICDSRMSLYKCGSVIPNELLLTGNDTGKLHVLVTFSIEDSMAFKTGSILFGDAIKSASHPIIYRFFTGYITDSCNLKLLQTEVFRNYGSPVSVCLPKGDYTMQIVIPESTETDFYFGSKIKQLCQFVRYKDELQSAFYKPQLAENMGKLLDDEKNHSKTDFFGSLDTVFYFDSYRYTGRFQFRTFRLTKPSYLKIEVSNRFTNNILLKGDYNKTQYNTSGTADSVRAIFSKEYVSRCHLLDTGIYTLATNLINDCDEKSRIDSCNITINVINLQPSNFNYPYKAHAVNNLQALSNNGSRPVANGLTQNIAIYNLAEGFYDCEVDSPSYRNTDCSSFEKHHLYYVFKIDQPSFMVIDSYAVLYPYDVRVDSLKMAQAGSSINPCGFSGFYSEYAHFCNLQPGVYTAVFTQKLDRRIIPTIQLSPAIASKHDFAKNAHDLGTITHGLNQSAGEMIGCLTGYSRSDYPSNNTSYFTEESIDYANTKNIVQNELYKGNVWYTFMVEDVGEVKLKIKNLYNNRLANLNQDFFIYQAPANQAIDFSKLQGSGQIDSTIAQGLILVETEGDEYEVTFTKEVCELTRYYVVVPAFRNYKSYHNNYAWIDNITTYFGLPNYKMQTIVEFNSQKNSKQGGDFCKEAVQIDLGDDESIEKKIIISCHTIGESYGEDGSNMDCLEDAESLKSTWYKIDYKGTQKNDIQFQIEENTSALPNEFKYRVLHGSCGSMQAGQCVEEINGSFKLDCVDDAAYFVQIVSPIDAIGTIKLTATTTANTDQNCVPFNPTDLMADFTASGGCSSKLPVQFFNSSTQGDDISYQWQFGDGESSTNKAPEHVFKNTSQNAVDSFLVKLKVTNNATLDSASTTKYVYIYNNLALFAGPDTSTFCGEILEMSPTLNFQPTAFGWFPSEMFKDATQLNARLNHKTGLASNWVWLEAQLGNCTITDSLQIADNYRSEIAEFGKLCSGDSLKIGYADTFPIYKWKDGTVLDSIYADKPGEYTLEFGYSESCLQTYSVTLELQESPIFTIEGQRSCVGDTVRIESNESDLSFDWNNGESTDDFFVLKDSGFISVTVFNQFNCKTDDGFYLSAKDFLSEFDYNVSICNGEKATLKAKVADAEYLWNTGETTQNIVVSDTGLYSVNIKKGNCEVINMVTVFENEKPDLVINDVNLCDTLQTKIELDTLYTYTWSDGFIGNVRTITKEGKYSVKAEHSGCDSTVTFMAKSLIDEDFKLGPDTQFCLPFEFALSTISAPKIKWSSGNTEDTFITVSDTGTYWIELEFDNCSVSDTVHIDTLDCYTGLYVPNAFTPQGTNDDLNPVFIAQGSNIVSFNMQIFNRFGQCIFETDDINEGWDGTYEGKESPVGVYVYVINYKAHKRAREYLAGNLTILR
ncbi:MAG: gliding motility-associated C-terminal domain-containing protein [Bacteroidetes bacterium]|nr:gliding motility-associated C-terminal domain-containing protein [Bacteroidota bacterium]